ncbi:hypothetical protein PF007_g10902 [Phytophthora fragariae]|uniref:Uncharacterized protein n=1 Tax=Phytophthora fragariae TaxID=53985 RepID=A0A6A4DM75_9STRA|nr:hypothetical protein PF009_g10319 [Phytophthora fragariae]KAE9112940.1 hypothetical protein PF007_g10902 [Phytophthora fragariae]KAE9145217.1 hypothetical protein PF006_g9912 [Phytophthora fragariae]KAE9310959.1 hypothetical protein PF001_g9944 [Phytophthora fragariae]KAE9343136.1 hypothetical protein PF008_g9827 [Phytophthora fragariae]
MTRAVRPQEAHPRATRSNFQTPLYSEAVCRVQTASATVTVTPPDELKPRILQISRNPVQLLDAQAVCRAGRSGDSDGNPSG